MPAISYSDLKRFPPQLWVLFVATMVNRMGTMVLPFLAIYLTTKRGFSVDSAGMVLGLYGLGALLSGLLSGWLCDRVGPTKVLVWSLFISSLVMFTFPVAQHLFSIILFTMLLSVFGETVRPASMTLTSRYAQPELRKSAFAVNRLAINLGMSIGPVVGGLLAEKDFFWIFLVDGVTTLAAGAFVAISLARLERKGVITSEEKTPSGFSSVISSFKEALKDRALFFFLFPVLILSMVSFQHESTLPIFCVKELGMNPSTYGLIFTVNAGLIIFLELPLNVATSHWSMKKTLVVGSLLFAVGFGSLMFASTVWHVVATVVVWTFGEMITFPGAAAYVSEISPKKSQGVYMGLFTSSFGLAFLLGPWAGALVMHHMGSTSLWIASFLFGLLAMFLFSKISEPKAVAL